MLGNGVLATDSSAALCRDFYTFFSKSESDSAWAAEESDLQELDQRAGGPWKVLSYCVLYVGYQTSVGIHGPTATLPRGKHWPWPWQNGNDGNSGNGSGGQPGGARGGNPGNPGDGGAGHQGSGNVTGPGTGHQGHGQPAKQQGSTSQQSNGQQ